MNMFKALQQPAEGAVTPRTSKRSSSLKANTLCPLCPSKNLLSSCPLFYQGFLLAKASWNPRARVPG